MSFLSRTRRATVIARGFSTEAPKTSIARNILRLSQIQAAKDENELKKVLASPLPAVEFGTLPKELGGLETYFAGNTSSGAQGFKSNQNAWQNQDFFSFAATEAQRTETWPFMVGFAAVFLLLGVGSAVSVDEEMRKNSKYAQLLDAKRGIVRHDNHGHGDHGHAHH